MTKTQPTHCRHGHEWTEENSSWIKARPGVRHCKACMRGRAQKAYAKNPEKFRALSITWKRANPEKARATERRTHLRENYGVTDAQYDAMLLGQNGVCAVCRNPEQSNWQRRGRPAASLRRLCVDHDHETGAVRGLLCNQCNMGLARFRDSAQFLRAAAEYLDNHHLTTVLA
jgi:hypothetical protein